MTKAAVFAGFLTVFFGWVAAAAFITIKIQSNPRIGKNLLFVEAVIFLNSVVIFLPLWILSGFWSWPLVGAALLLGNVGVFISYIASELMGPADQSSFTRRYAAGIEWDTKHPNFNKFAVPLAFLASSSAYLIASGWFFFAWNPSPARTTMLLQIALAYFFVFGIAAMGSVLSSLTASKNLDNEARNGLLAEQLGGLVNTALFLGLVFTSFNATDDTSALTAWASWTLAAQIAVALFILFLVTNLLPQLIGSRRAQRWRTGLTDEKRRFLSELIGILGTPLPSEYSPRLSAFADRIRARSAEFEDASKDVMFAILDDIARKVAANEPLNAAEQAIYDSRGSDPRFRHAAWLRAVANGPNDGIGVVIDDLALKTTDKDRKEQADGWGKRFTGMRADLDDEQKKESEERSLMPTFTLWIIGATVPALISYVAVLVWKSMIPATGSQ